MNLLKFSTVIFFLFALTFTLNFTEAQTQYIDAIEYRQISNFETDYSISSMKMSADGSRIVFATGGPQVKIFTINTNGSGLTLVYDFQTTGNGSFIDISADGNKVIWYRYGTLFSSFADGSSREQLAPLLPNPNPIFADIVPEIPLPPRITADGTQVFFINMSREPLASGVWKVNSDGSNLTQVFNYLELAQEVFGRDGTEYNYNTGFTDGFDISGNGSRMIFGTSIFKSEIGDLNRGDAIVFDNGTFYNLGDYARGHQPFSTGYEGNNFIMWKREYNANIEYDEINVYFVPLGTGSNIKVISGLDIFGTSAFTQMIANGSQAIIIGENGKLPITRVNIIGASRLDLVSINGISRAIGNFNFSESLFPSINLNGNQFCFLVQSNPAQIWFAEINSDAINSQPSITEVEFNPDFVLIDGSTTSTFSAHVTSPPYSIHTVTIETFKDGVEQFRGIKADYTPFIPVLVDDGTLGDNNAGDGYYSNNTVRADLPETPTGSYTIRLAAVNSTLREVTMVDAEPFSILDQPNAVTEPEVLSTEFYLHQNYPNPFNPSTVISYSLPSSVKSETSSVKLIVFDIMGKEVETLINERQKPGYYEKYFNAENLSSGVYFYKIIAGDFVDIKKMIMIR